MTRADRQVAQFEKSLAVVINRLQTLILATAKTGELFSMDSEARIRFAPDLLAGLTQALEQSGYNSTVQQMLDNDSDLIAEVRAMRKAASLPTAFGATAPETLQAFRNLELQQFANIGNNFVNSLHQELMNYAVSGIDEKSFIAAIRSKLESSLQRYAVTYANTSRAQFIQQVQLEAAKEYDGELYWEYVGADDDRTREACQEGLAQRYFTDDERLEFELATADERAWNCRHIFQQITKEDYEQGTGK